MIPKILHFIWIGDECWTHPTEQGPLIDIKKRPDNLIKSWKDKHPLWDIRIWGNNDFHHGDWYLKEQMLKLYGRSMYAGVADLMRYQIIYKYGGVYIDADTACYEPIDDLLDCKAFVVRSRNNIISNGYIGAIKEYPLFGWMIKHLFERGNDCLFWRGKSSNVQVAIGPQFLTYAINKSNTDITILPYYTFMPNDLSYHHIPIEGQKIYGEHLWYGNFINC